jgi:hypothetical protein
MASLQARRVRGHTSWDLVESRRINGKPRPIPLAYLGKADARLARLQATETLRRRSGAALAAAHPRQAPVTRDGLTVGQTVTLVGIGRACHATSKRGFADWARPPSLGDLAGTNGERLTRQHFWDQMDPAPGESLAPIACEIVRRVLTRLALHGQLTGPDPPLTLPYQFSREAFEALARAQPGRVVLITDRHDWATTDSIQAYHGPAHGEAVYGDWFQRRIKSLGVEQVLPAPRRPWQNAYAERLIGSIRRECLDQVTVFSEGHLRRLLASYLQYYHRWRTHLSLAMDCPDARLVQPPDQGWLSRYRTWMGYIIIMIGWRMMCVPGCRAESHRMGFRERHPPS